MAKKPRSKKKNTIRSLLRQREDVLDKIADEELYQELNVDDHPISFPTSKKDKDKSREREKKLRIRLKNIKKLIGNLKGRGGGGSIKMPTEYSTKPRLIRKM